MNLTDDIKIAIDIIDDNLDVETKFSKILNLNKKYEKYEDWHLFRLFDDITDIPDQNINNKIRISLIKLLFDRFKVLSNSKCYNPTS